MARLHASANVKDFIDEEALDGEVDQVDLENALHESSSEDQHLDDQEHSDRGVGDAEKESAEYNDEDAEEPPKRPMRSFKKLIRGD